MPAPAIIGTFEIARPRVMAALSDPAMWSPSRLFPPYWLTHIPVASANGLVSLADIDVLHHDALLPAVPHLV